MRTKHTARCIGQKHLGTDNEFVIYLSAMKKIVQQILAISFLTLGILAVSTAVANATNNSGTIDTPACEPEEF